MRSIASCGMASKYDLVIGDWSFSDFTSGKLSLCNINFGIFHNLSILHVQRVNDNLVSFCASCSRSGK